MARKANQVRLMYIKAKSTSVSMISSIYGGVPSLTQSLLILATIFFRAFNLVKDTLMMIRYVILGIVMKVLPASP